MQRTYQSPTSDRSPPAQRADDSIPVQAINSSTVSNTSTGAADHSAGSSLVVGTISDQSGTAEGARPLRVSRSSPHLKGDETNPRPPFLVEETTSM